MKSIKGNILDFYRRFRFKSIFFKNLIFYTIIVMIPLFFFACVYYGDVKRNSYEEMKNINTMTLRTVHDTTDAIISELMQYVYKTCIDNDTVVFMASDNPEFNNNSLWEKIKENNKRFSDIYNDIDSIYIYSELREGIIHDNGYSAIGDFSDVGWYDTYEKADSDRIQIFLRNKSDIYPSLITIMKPNTFHNKKVGAIVINVDISKLIPLNGLNKGLDQSLGLMIDETGGIYYSKQNCWGKNFFDLINENNWTEVNNNKTDRVKIESKKYDISFLKSQHGGIYYVLLYPMSAFGSHMASVMRITVFVIVLFLICGIMLVFYMTYFSVRPINNIVDFIDSIEYNEDIINSTSTDELNYIIKYTRELIRAKNDAKSELKINSINLKKAYNLALRSQINSHFLCNTLEVINWKSIELNGGDNMVSEMITDLGDIYSYLLRENSYFAMVKEEISYIQLYSKILEYRYKNKFDIIWNINNDILDFKILKLSLQPIFENAVYHGIKPLRQKGTITVTGGFIGDDIFIEIEDDGVGMSESKLDRLKADMDKSFDIFEEHIGIANVNQRMKMVYSQGYGLEIKSKQGVGTSVRLIFPKEF